MNKIKIAFTSIRVKLFIFLCVSILSIIVIVLLLNNFVLEDFYLYNKENKLKEVYTSVNEFYNNGYSQEEIENQLEEISIKNDFDILIKDSYDETIYISNKDFFSNMLQQSIMNSKIIREQYNLMAKEDKSYIISEMEDSRTNINYVMITAIMDNGYKLYMRMPIISIQESVKITNKFLYIIAFVMIIVGGIFSSLVSQRFCRPIEELKNIAKKMSNLDFSQKYNYSPSQDEFDELGKSINKMSRKLESTIGQLRAANMELEKDVEEKSHIDEMRKSFISDVSHELKTPIALIQGYSEGLIENVNTDEESRKFYAEVILDEATKMDKLVKRLLELMKLEYGNMRFNNVEFNIIELEREILRKSNVMIEKEKINVEFKEEGEINVIADEDYIDLVFTNYITNAIKYSTEINGIRKIEIKNEIREADKKVRISVFNTLEEMPEEELVHIWNRFYKIDESRNRSEGGNGIGLAIVKAIMNNYGNEYGARNVIGGIEFYFDLDLA